LLRVKNVGGSPACFLSSSLTPPEDSSSKVHHRRWGRGLLQPTRGIVGDMEVHNVTQEDSDVESLFCSCFGFRSRQESNSGA